MGNIFFYQKHEEISVSSYIFIYIYVFSTQSVRADKFYENSMEVRDLFKMFFESVKHASKFSLNTYEESKLT